MEVRTLAIRADAAVEGNTRLTAANAAVLLVVLVGFAPRDWLRRARGDIGGAGIRQWLIAARLAIEALADVLVLSRVGPWLAVSGQ